MAAVPASKFQAFMAHPAGKLFKLNLENIILKQTNIYALFFILLFQDQSK